MKFLAFPELKAKIARLRDVRSHVNNGDLAKLVDELADLGLEKWDPLKKAARAMAKSQLAKETAKPEFANVAIENPEVDNVEVDTATNIRPGDATRPVAHQKQSVIQFAGFISSTARHFVFLRDGGACRNCSSTKFVQVDHIIPVALGGSSEPENLQLLCRKCNQRRAIETYGVSKMNRYLKSPTKDFAS
ncbi:MAG: HNH endonuclease signature motif containing protein [Bdellovibrionota bacterium]